MAATVLVVDDEPRIRELYARWLDADYDVRTASGGPEALDQLDETVDVVLLDRRMPRMSGDEVLARIRDREGSHDPWVVMVTAVDPDLDVVDAVESMFDRADHDDALRTYFETMAKLGLLEASLTRQELAESDEYAKLKTRHLKAKDQLSDAVEATRERGEFEELFVEMPEHPPEEEL